MSKYNVFWLPSAEQHLTDIWINAHDKRAVRAAADEMDRRLADSPAGQGESRDDRVRIAFAPPLGIEFEIVEQDRKVLVLAV